MLPAAWRKMCVKRVVGTSSEATSSANGLPAPTGASWSASPTSTTWVCAPDRAQQRHQQLQVGHRGLVDDQQIAAQRILLVVGRSLAGNPAQGRVHGSRPHPAGLAHSHGGAPRGGDQEDAGAVR